MQPQIAHMHRLLKAYYNGGMSFEGPCRNNLVIVYRVLLHYIRFIRCC